MFSPSFHLTLPCQCSNRSSPLLPLLFPYSARQAGVALGVLSAMHQLAAILLWLVVPWVVARKSEMLLNTLEYVAKKPQSPLNKLLLAYFVLFLLTLAAQVLFLPRRSPFTCILSPTAPLLLPQIAYYALETIPFLSSFLLPSLPWHSSSSPAWLINLDLTILGMGFFFSLLMIQVTLLLIALSAHLQVLLPLLFSLHSAPSFFFEILSMRLLNSFSWAPSYSRPSSLSTSTPPSSPRPTCSSSSSSSTSPSNPCARATKRSSPSTCS